MSFGDPNNPYGQPQDPNQGQQPGYGYPQQAPQGVPPQQGYGYPQQQPGAYPQAPGTLQANNGYISVHGLGTVKVASMGLRFAARLIDGLAIGAIVGVLFAIGVAGALGIGSAATESCSGLDQMSPAYDTCLNEQLEASSGIFAALLGMAALVGIATMLYEWLMISFVGATLGKMALGLRVVKEATGGKPGLGGGFVRWIIPIVGAFLCYIGAILVYLSPFFDNSGKLQGWHDRAAGTLVIKK
ncbi:RDD family protein [Streptomyces exfoliatus]|uniref:RDD family protein n=1 Tax=Streptomyces exfoliatus TaxID=1905 RepID=UPI0004C5BFA5|nr:RDD family protein [Streptomyces exfoliatus]